MVDIGPGPDDRTILASVTWARPRRSARPPGWDALGCDPARPVAHLSLGNPHAVVAVDDVDDVDLAALGAWCPTSTSRSSRAGPEADAITMRVHERGAGITEACGTGACAAAHAAHAWGLADAADGEITVHMTGGDAKVRVGGRARPHRPRHLHRPHRGAHLSLIERAVRERIVLVGVTLPPHADDEPRPASTSWPS